MRLKANWEQVRGKVGNWERAFISKAAHMERSRASGHHEGIYLVMETWVSAGQVHVPTGFKNWYCSWEGYGDGGTYFDCGEMGIEFLIGKYY
jgi:hypothetical protein